MSFIIHVALRDSNPLIWRRIAVPENVTFFDLHHIIQIAMGWENSHLFEFIVGDYTLGYISPAEPFTDIADADQVKLDLILSPGVQFVYAYDFGADWVHMILVEEVSDSPLLCVGGANACPPENAGGIHIYNETLKKRKSETKEFDPENLDIESINKKLPFYREMMKDWNL